MVVFPFVQCRLVAPLVVDGSPDSVSPRSEGVNGVTGRVSQVVHGSGGSICSEELVVVPCGAKIGGYCGWSSVWGLHHAQ